MTDKKIPAPTAPKPPAPPSGAPGSAPAPAPAASARPGFVPSPTSSPNSSPTTNAPQSQAQPPKAPVTPPPSAMKSAQTPLKPGQPVSPKPAGSGGQPLPAPTAPAAPKPATQSMPAPTAPKAPTPPAAPTAAKPLPNPSATPTPTPAKPVAGPVPTPKPAASLPPIGGAPKPGGSPAGAPRPMGPILPKPGGAPAPSAIPTPPTTMGKPAFPPLAPGPGGGKLPPRPPGAPLAPAAAGAAVGAGGALPKPPASGGTPAKPQAAEYKKSPLRFVPIILGVLVVLALGSFIFSKLFGGRNTSQSVAPDEVQTGTKGTNTGSNTTGSSQPVTLTYWGLWEDDIVLQGVLADFQKEHPNITVQYQKQSYKDVRERLQTAITSGRGPDVFRFHATWTPMLRAELAPMPSTVYSGAEYQNTFYPLASQLLSLNGQIYGVPIMYDGLALYYNEDALRAANAQPPKSWADLKTLATQLTIRSNGKLERGGVALGTSSNVDNFSDILGLLILQNGGDPTDPTSQAAKDALTFYTSFVKTDKVWDDKLPSSTVAFARGDVAMMLAPSWRAHDIIALNPNLKFGVATVPQLQGTKIAWGTFWAEGVNNQSKNKNEAWLLVKYLSSPEVEKKLYDAESRTRTFGEIYSRKDLASQLASDPFVGAFVEDAPYARGWFMSSDTHDNGINDQIIKYYNDAVNAMLGGTSDATKVTATVQQGTNQVLRQYNVSTAQSQSLATGK